MDMKTGHFLSTLHAAEPASAVKCQLDIGAFVAGSCPPLLVNVGNQMTGYYNIGRRVRSGEELLFLRTLLRHVM